MKKNIFALVLIFMLFTLTGYGEVNPKVNLFANFWQTDTPFTSKEGRFSINLPTGFDTFKYEKLNKTTDSGDLEINQYSSDMARGTCMLAYYDLPANVFESKSIQQMLEDGRDGSIKNVNGTLQKQEDITVDGYTGLSIYVQIQNSGRTIYARSDFVIAKPRIYNYLYLSTDEAEMSKADVKNYFKSFHIQK